MWLLQLLNTLKVLCMAWYMFLATLIFSLTLLLQFFQYSLSKPKIDFQATWFLGGPWRVQGVGFTMRFSHEIKNEVFFFPQPSFFCKMFLCCRCYHHQSCLQALRSTSLLQSVTQSCLSVSFPTFCLVSVKTGWPDFSRYWSFLLHNNSCFEIPQPLALYNVLNFLNSLLFFFLLSLWVLPLFLALFLFLFLFGFVFLFLLGVVGIGSLFFLF